MLYLESSKRYPMDALVEARMQMIEAGGRTAESFGISGLLGRIYMFLYLSREPQCLAQLVVGLGVTTARASIAGRQRRSLPALEPGWREGGGRDMDEFETHLGTLLRAR